MLFKLHSHSIYGFYYLCKDNSNSPTIVKQKSDKYFFINNDINKINIQKIMLMFVFNFMLQYIIIMVLLILTA